MRELTCLLIRHGLTKGNIEKRYVGCRTDEELSEQGIRSLEGLNFADSIVSLLKEESFSSIADCGQTAGTDLFSNVYISPMLRCRQTAGTDLFSGVYISPMLRCRQTADILMPDVKQIVIDDFREMDFGDFEYRNYQELSGNSNYQKWIDSNGMLPFPGGEKREDFIKRNIDAFKAVLLEEEKKDNCRVVPFVIHGGSIMAIMSSLTGGEYYDYQLSCGDAYIARIGVDDDRIYIISYDRISFGSDT